MHRIDVHHHIVPPTYVQTVGPARVYRQTGRAAPPSAGWTVEKSLEQMDRNGIATAMTSLSAPGTWFGDVAQGRKLSRECNEYAARIAGDHPGRFGSLVSLPMGDIEGSLSEIEYAFDTLKADGVVMMTSYDNQWLGEEKFRPVFEELNRRRATVLFHPTVAPCCEALMTDIPDALVEFMFETVRTVTSMLYSGSFTRYGDMRFIVPHCGSAVPLLKARIAAMWNWNKPVAERLPKGPLHELQKLYYDVALSARPECFAPLLELVTARNIVFGSDYPWGNMTLADTIAGVVKQGFSAEELRMIDRDNALGLFPKLR